MSNIEKNSNLPNKRWLFLDDKRYPTDCVYYIQENIYLEYHMWDIVRDFEEFCGYIQNYFEINGEIPEIISFDHDLASEHYDYLQHPIPYDKFSIETGYHCALWLKNFCEEKGLSYPKVICHSMNSAGKDNILSLFVS